MQKFLHLLADSPGVVAQLVVAVFGLLASFGLAVNDVQSGAVVAVVIALGAIVASLIGREKTVPKHRVLSYKQKEDGTVKYH